MEPGTPVGEGYPASMFRKNRKRTATIAQITTELDRRLPDIMSLEYRLFEESQSVWLFTISPVHSRTREYLTDSPLWLKSPIVDSQVINRRLQRIMIPH